MIHAIRLILLLIGLISVLHTEESKLPNRGKYL